MMKKTLLVFSFFCFTWAATAQNIPELKMADVVKLFKTKSDTVYVVNFWATFCKPCVAEIPEFIRVTDKYKKQKVKLLLVSLDLPSFYPKRIAAFAAKNNFNTNIAWLNETDADYFCPMIDTAWSGAIPATIIVNTKTGYKKFFEAEMKGEEFEMELKKAIGDNRTSFAKPTFFMPMNEVALIDCHDGNSPVRLSMPFTTFQSKDSTVFSVSEGEVSNVISVENMEVVIIQKDKLFFTYSNLKSVLVKRGDKINTDQVIGYASFDLDSIMPTVDFYMNNAKGTITLSQNNFKPRRNNNSKEHSFDSVKEPE